MAKLPLLIILEAQYNPKSNQGIPLVFPDYIWLHIRGVGQWTNRLYSYFEREQARLHGVDLPAIESGHE